MYRRPPYIHTCSGGFHTHIHTWGLHTASAHTHTRTGSLRTHTHVSEASVHTHTYRRPPYTHTHTYQRPPYTHTYQRPPYAHTYQRPPYTHTYQGKSASFSVAPSQCGLDSSLAPPICTSNTPPWVSKWEQRGRKQTHSHLDTHDQWSVTIHLLMQISNSYKNAAKWGDRGRKIQPVFVCLGKIIVCMEALKFHPQISVCKQNNGTFYWKSLHLSGRSTTQQPFPSLLCTLGYSLCILKPCTRDLAHTIYIHARGPHMNIDSWKVPEANNNVGDCRLVLHWSFRRQTTTWVAVALFPGT